MSKLEKLKFEVARLPKEFSEFCRWIFEWDWAYWDDEITADFEAGRLEFLVREAFDAKAKGKLKEL